MFHPVWWEAAGLTVQVAQQLAEKYLSENSDWLAKIVTVYPFQSKH